MNTTPRLMAEEGAEQGAEQAAEQAQTERETAHGVDVARAVVVRAAERGMTLIEIMVVIVIIGVMGSALAVGVFGMLGDAKTDTGRAQINTMGSVIEAHEARFGCGAGVQFAHCSVQRVHRGRQGEIAGSVEVKSDIRSGNAIGRQRRCAVA